MGTDIHGRLQVRWNADSPWQDAGPIEDNRNYRVFAMLAGVRNGFGFAGVTTHEPLVPISGPRGLPDDIAGDDHIMLDDGSEYWLGDHSHSWLFVKEIVDWPGWDKPLRMCGFLSPSEYERVVATGETPHSWCGRTSDSSYRHHEWTVPFTEYTKTFRAWIEYVHLKHGDHARIVFGFDS